MIGGILTGADLQLLLPPKRIQGTYIARQLPLAIAQLVIKPIPFFRATSNNNTTAMDPVLHTHTNSRTRPQTRLPRFAFAILLWLQRLRLTAVGHLPVTAVSLAHQPTSLGW